MARFKTKVTVEGIKELQAKVTDVRVLRDPMQDLLTAATNVGQRAAMDAMDGGTGKAVRSVSVYVNPADAKVVTLMATTRSRSINVGRRRNEVLTGIYVWAHAVGYSGNIHLLINQLHARGTKGKHFKEAAVSKVTEALPSLMDRMAAAVKERID